MMNQKDQDEELTKRTLLALNDMRIKFPGKSDEEAEYILDSVRFPVFEVHLSMSKM